MAQRVVRQLIDDIDGAEIAEGRGESIEFAVRGVSYRIDLSAPNAQKFDKALKPFVDAAERVGGTRRRQSKASGGSKSSPEQLTAIREWARKKGYEVSDRGRIKTEIIEAFEAAH